MTISFDALWNAYPTGTREDLFNALGGGWPALIVDTQNFGNTCALRLSVAMLAIRETPPADLVTADGNLKDGQGNPLIIRVSSARQWLNGLLGDSTWGTSKEIGASIEPLIPAWTGILLYRVPGATDASGHVDLWDKTYCRNDCHSTFATQATSVELWQLQ